MTAVLVLDFGKVGVRFKVLVTPGESFKFPQTPETSDGADGVLI